MHHAELVDYCTYTVAMKKLIHQVEQACLLNNHTLAVHLTSEIQTAAIKLQNYCRKHQEE